MHIKADFTKEELAGQYDILSQVCHPIGRIKTLSALLAGLNSEDIEAGNVLNKANVEMLGEMLTDACVEIEYLVDIANEQWRHERLERKVSHA